MDRRSGAVCLLVAASLALVSCTRADETTTESSIVEAAASTSEETTTTTTTTTTTQTPPGTSTSTAAAEATLRSQAIWLFPGPHHYSGDVLTAQLPLGDFDDHSLGEITITVDGERVTADAELSSDPLLGGYITVKDVYDTTGAVGTHRLVVSGTLDGDTFHVSATFEVLPDAARSEQERIAVWASTDTECCIVHYLEGSAAARDLHDVAGVVDSSALAVEEALGIDLPTIEIVLLDVLWGNGGYAGGELVISYLDRDFGPTTIDTVGITFVHEMTHAASRALPGDAPWPLDEALAVYIAGGHFKPENLHDRAAALSERGELLPLAAFLDEFDVLQHESRYVQAGSLATYLVEAHGWDAFVDIYTTPNRTSRISRWFDRAAAEAVGLGLEEIDAGYREWVARGDASASQRDLDLSIALQDARRMYQANYALYQNFFVYESVLAAGTPTVALRETRDPASVGVEALIAWAQRLIVDGRLDLAASAVAEIEQIAATGVIDGDHGLRSVAIANELSRQGYELLSAELEGDVVPVTATNGHPRVFDFTAEFDSGGAVTIVGPVAETS